MKPTEEELEIVKLAESIPPEKRVIVKAFVAGLEAAREAEKNKEPA